MKTKEKKAATFFGLHYTHKKKSENEVARGREGTVPRVVLR